MTPEQPTPPPNKKPGRPRQRPDGKLSAGPGRPPTGEAKEPTIVRGNNHKKRFRKAPAAEVEERLEEVCAMLANKFRRTDIIRAFRDLNAKVQKELNPQGLTFTPEQPAPAGYYKYDLDWRTIDRYTSQARELALRRSRKTRADALCESVSYWESVVRDRSATRAERNYAQKQLDEIFGVHAPKQVRMTTPPGQPIAVRDETPGRPLRHVPTERLLEIANLGTDRKN